jgi:DNA polymerase-3 subunit beta
MKVKFDTAELQHVLSQLSSIVSSKAAQPVLGFVRLVASENEPGKFTVSITGMDIDRSLTRFFVKATAEGAVDVLLPFDKLTKLVAYIKNQEITISSADETKATVVAGKHRTELKPHPLANWLPALERPEDATATVGLAGFKDQILNVEFAVPANDGKFTVTVAKVEAVADAPAEGDKPAVPGFVRFVATDGFRIAISTIAASIGTFELILPKTALELIKKLDGGDQLTIREAESGFYFETALEVLTVQRTHGVFPNYARVIPKDFKAEIAVDKLTLLDAIHRVRVSADNDKPIINIKGKDGDTVLSIATSSPDSGVDGTGSFLNTSNDEIDATIKGGDVAVTLNADFLVPFLDRAFGSKTGVVTIRLQSASNPVDFWANDGTYRFLQMPTAA